MTKTHLKQALRRLKTFARLIIIAVSIIASLVTDLRCIVLVNKRKVLANARSPS